MTERYAHLAPEHKVSAVEKLVFCNLGKTRFILPIHILRCGFRDIEQNKAQQRDHDT